MEPTAHKQVSKTLAIDALVKWAGCAVGFGIAAIAMVAGGDQRAFAIVPALLCGLCAAGAWVAHDLVREADSARNVRG